MTPAVAAIDELMDRASEALVATEYFDSERLCLRALRQARSHHDFERMARICLPLQESRRQMRQAAEQAGVRAALSVQSDLRVREPGCYLLQPPLIGIDARGFRESAARRKVPVFVLVREPMTRTGKWPLVAVAESSVKVMAGSMTSVRVQTVPPEGVTFTDQGPTRDRMEALPSLRWYTASAEALGDAAVAIVDRTLPSAYQVDDLVDLLDAIPEHEKLHQALAAACRAAALEPLPQGSRRPPERNPFSF